MKIVFALLAMLILWSAFLPVPIWLTGLILCRQNAWWTAQDKIQAYFSLTSPKAAKFLIGRYSGYRPDIRTNLPIFYRKYRVNEYPSRLSALGAVNYCVTAVISL